MIAEESFKILFKVIQTLGFSDCSCSVAFPFVGGCDGEAACPLVLFGGLLLGPIKAVAWNWMGNIGSIK